MNVIKIAAGFVCSLIIVLSVLIVFVENAEKELYEKTVESIMIHEKWSSSQEVLDSFPELRDIQSKMERIAFLNRNIHSLTGGPAPNVSREESLQIRGYTHEIRQHQRSIKQELSQLIAIYKKDQP